MAVNLARQQAGTIFLRGGGKLFEHLLEAGEGSMRVARQKLHGGFEDSPPQAAGNSLAEAGSTAGNTRLRQAATLLKLPAVSGRYARRAVDRDDGTGSVAAHVRQVMDNVESGLAERL